MTKYLILSNSTYLNKLCLRGYNRYELYLGNLGISEALCSGIRLLISSDHLLRCEISIGNKNDEIVFPLMSMISYCENIYPFAFFLLEQIKLIPSKTRNFLKTEIAETNF